MAKVRYQEELNEKLEANCNEIKEQLPDFVLPFLDSLELDNASYRTIYQYACDLKWFFDYLQTQPGFNRINIKTASASDVLDKLTIDDIQEYQKQVLSKHEVKDKLTNRKVTRPYSDSFKARKASSLRSMFVFFHKTGKIKNSLADLIKIAEIKNDKIIHLADDDISAMLNAALSNPEPMIAKRDYAILMLFFGTGIRVSELVGIDLADLNFYKYSKDNTKGSVWVIRKGGNKEEVFFSTSVKDALADYIDNYRDNFFLSKDGSKYAKTPANEPALFISFGQRKRMSVRSVQQLVERCKQIAGLPEDLKVTPHTLRRSYGTYLYAQSGDIYLVASSLGHKSVETTRKHYTDISDKQKMKAANISEGMFKK